MYKSEPTFTLENLLLEEALGDVQVKFHQWPILRSTLLTSAFFMYTDEVAGLSSSFDKTVLGGFGGSMTSLEPSLTFAAVEMFPSSTHDASQAESNSSEFMVTLIAGKGGAFAELSSFKVSLTGGIVDPRAASFPDSDSSNSSLGDKSSFLSSTF